VGRVQFNDTWQSFSTWDVARSCPGESGEYRAISKQAVMKNIGMEPARRSVFMHIAEPTIISL
jgi:hypothetical protein